MHCKLAYKQKMNAIAQTDSQFAYIVKVPRKHRLKGLKTSPQMIMFVNGGSWKIQKWMKIIVK